jgi:hypothetical protein
MGSNLGALPVEVLAWAAAVRAKELAVLGTAASRNAKRSFRWTGIKTRAELNIASTISN